LALLLLMVLLQGPGDGWTLAESPPREVRRVYWELFETTEIWVRLLPEGPHATPPFVNLIFQAYFPGRAKRDPYTGLLQWPKGEPQRLTLRALPLPLTMIRGLSLRLVIDGNKVDLTGTAHEYRYLGCPPGDLDCAPSGIEAEIKPSLLKSLTTAREIRGEALGFPIELREADQLALDDFTERIGLVEEKTAK
jgi:hypothetical protein